MTKFKSAATTAFTPKKSPSKRIYNRETRALAGLPQLEDDIHIVVVQICRYLKYQGVPVVNFLHHSPNGGRRSKREAGRFKAMGTKPGFPDLFLFIAAGGYHGLFIEMKSETGTTTESQKEMIKLLTEQGYKCVICRSSKEAEIAIKEYLNI